jgi:catechol 2,3-dioxygenase
MKQLSINGVTLNVQNLETMTAFYKELIGLSILTHTSDTAVLGAGATPLITLRFEPSLKRAPSTEAGLYHFAILFSSQKHLAQTLLKIFQITPHLFTGSGDHLVSEAFYFNDPEGNGIELYWDRDQSEWEWVGNEIKMDVKYIDPNAYLNLHLVKSEDNESKKIGHMHLKVGNLSEAQKFYVDILHFEVTAKLPEALFVSVDKYHHHIGLNTWESAGSSKRNDSLGLHSFQMELPKEEVLSLEKRLTDNSIEYQRQTDDLVFSDPWDNTIVVTTQKNQAE